MARKSCLVCFSVATVALPFFAGQIALFGVAEMVSEHDAGASIWVVFGVGLTAWMAGRLHGLLRSANQVLEQWDAERAD